MLIGIYPRKLLFFAFIALAIFGGVKIFEAARLPEVSASTADNINQAEFGGSYYLELDLTKSGSLYIESKKLKESVTATSDYDELRYIVLNQPNDTYTDAKIVLNLPYKIKKLYGDPRIIAVHGANPAGAYLTSDGEQIVFSATDVGDASTVTIIAQFPKGYLNLPAAKQIGGVLSNVPGWFWVLISLVLPVIAVVIIAWMFYFSDIRAKPQAGQMMRKNLPSEISPGVVSTLFSGTVGARTLMATLVDLARRGVIEIFNRGEDFVIHRKPISPQEQVQLKPFEKILVEKLFLPKENISASMDVEKRLARHLYSRKIAEIYLAVYEEGKSLGYFAQLPARIHLKYRMIGIGLFYSGFIGLVVFGILGPDPKFILFMWMALVVLGILIINLAPRLTAYTTRGRKEQLEWAKFKNFLSESSNLKGRDELFDLYLPYAIALCVEADWAARFIESSFVKPDWYDHINLQGGVDKFVESFLPVIDQIGENLNLANEPLVR